MESAKKEYMLLLYGDRRQPERPRHSPSRDEIVREFHAWVEGLRTEGRFVTGDALTMNRSYLVERKISKDGPFAEAKEIMNGFFIIRASGMEEAVTISESHPCFRYGGSLEIIELAGR
jgi:hypothetical protein